MSIAVIQMEDQLFSIHPADELTLQVADFLKKNADCTITSIAKGKIEGQIINNDITVREIAASLSSYLNYKIESDSADHTKWTLYSKEEAEYYEHYGV